MCSEYGQLRPDKKDIAAVIVSYNPAAGFGERVGRLTNQTGGIIIVDNCSDTDVRAAVEGLNIVFIGNDRNMGIATALNQGVRKADEMGFRRVLMLDDDSVADEDMVDGLIRAYLSYHLCDRIGVIGANARDSHGRKLFKIRQDGRLFTEVRSVITSGSFMPVDVYRQAGPFRDEFFMEGVDIEYCLRLRRLGFKVLLTNKTLMEHRFGQMDRRNLLGRSVLVDNHAPWRYYYRIRNLTTILFEYSGRETAWCLSAVVNSVKMSVKILLFEERKLKKFCYMWLGMWDAFFRPQRKRFEK